MYYPNTCIQLVKLKGDEGVSNLALFGYLATQIIFKMHDVSVSMQRSVEVREFLKPKRTIRACRGHRGGAGAGCRGCVPKLQTVGTVEYGGRGGGGAAHHGWTLSGPPPSNRGSADRIGGGSGRKGGAQIQHSRFQGLG